MSDVIKIAGVAFMGGMLALTVKKDKPEFALLISLVTALIISIEIIIGVGNVVSQLEAIVVSAGMEIKYLAVCIKAVGCAYVTQFAAEILRDAGEGAIAGKVEMAGKVTILLFTIPILSAFLEMCIKVVKSV